MPKTQTAQVSNYDFGAPAVKAQVLQFTAKHGGTLEMDFSNLGDTDLKVSVDVSVDGTTWVASAIADDTVIPRCSEHKSLILRESKDLFVRVQGAGGVRGQMQVRGGEACGLDIVRI